MKMEQTECSETSAYKLQTPGITQKKAYNIQNTAKTWNQELPVLFIRFSFRFNEQSFCINLLLFVN